jgi:hypothetical protein
MGTGWALAMDSKSLAGVRYIEGRPYDSAERLNRPPATANGHRRDTD